MSRLPRIPASLSAPPKRKRGRHQSDSGTRERAQRLPHVAHHSQPTADRFTDARTVGAAAANSLGRAKEAAIGKPETESSREPTDLQDHRDRELLHRVGAGSEDAFGDLYRRYGAAAYGLALRVAGDRALAEDVVQEVFVSIWQRAGSFDPARGSVRSWLLTQVHHRAVDAVRREEAQRRRAAAADLAGVEDPEDIVEEGWLTARRRQVRRTLGSLEPEQRTVIELAYFGALTQSEVARRLGIPLGTVKSRTLAAMRRLRELVERGDS